jgi:conjugal transfer pilus assembly protein TraE
MDLAEKNGFKNMLFEKFKRKAKEATTVNGVLLIATVLSSAALFMLSTKVASMHERVVVTPPHITERMEVGWDSANQEYYKSFGLYLSGLVGNITPKNADFIIEALSSFLDPTIYSEVRSKLRAMTNDPVFLDSGTYSYFSPNSVVYEPEKNRVFIIGDLMMGSSARQPRAQSVVYEFVITIKDGRPFVRSVNNYAGSEAKTEAWKATHPVEQEQKDKK